MILELQQIRLRPALSAVLRNRLKINNKNYIPVSPHDTPIFILFLNDESRTWRLSIWCIFLLVSVQSAYLNQLYAILYHKKLNKYIEVGNGNNALSTGFRPRQHFSWLGNGPS